MINAWNFVQYVEWAINVNVATIYFHFEATRVRIPSRLPANIAVSRPLSTLQANGIRLDVAPCHRIVVPVRVVVLARLLIVDLTGEAQVVGNR